MRLHSIVALEPRGGDERQHHAFPTKVAKQPAAIAGYPYLSVSPAGAYAVGLMNGEHNLLT